MLTIEERLRTHRTYRVKEWIWDSEREETNLRIHADLTIEEAAKMFTGKRCGYICERMELIEYFADDDQYWAAWKTPDETIWFEGYEKEVRRALERA